MTITPSKWATLSHDLLFHILSVQVTNTRTIQAVLCVCKEWHKLKEKEYFKKTTKLTYLRLRYKIRQFPNYGGDSKKFYFSAPLLWNIVANAVFVFTEWSCKGYHLLENKKCVTAQFQRELIQPTARGNLFCIKNEIGFFATNQGRNLDKCLVKIFNLSNGWPVATVDLKDTLSPAEKADPYLQYQECIAIYVLKNNQMITVTNNGMIALWDIKNIFQPELISKKTLSHMDQSKYINAVFNHGSLLFFQDVKKDYSISGSHLHVFDLETSNVICTWDLTHLIQGVTDKIYFYNNFVVVACKGSTLGQNKLYGYRYDNNQFSLIWETESTDKISISSGENPLSPPHPYLLLTSYEKSKKYMLTVLDIRTGKDVLRIDYPLPPCLPNSDCNLKKHGAATDKCSFDWADIHLFEDVMVLVTKHQIDLWTIPFGTHRCIQLPLVNNLYHSNELPVSAFWDRNSLILKYPIQGCNQTSENVVDIYESPEKLTSPPTFTYSRKSFAWLAMTRLFALPLMTSYITAMRIIRFISLIDFWNPGARSISFQAKLKRSAMCLRQIVAVPLLTIGIEFALVCGVLSPSLGEKMFRFFQIWLLSLEDDFSQKFL